MIPGVLFYDEMHLICKFMERKVCEQAVESLFLFCGENVENTRFVPYSDECFTLNLKLYQSCKNTNNFVDI